MSDETTETLPNGPSFEERVLASLNDIQNRLRALEDQAERRAIDTKPIWEHALAEILEVKQGLGEVKQNLGNVERKIDVLSRV